MTKDDQTIINQSDLTVGVMSDTHGLLRPEVFDAFQDVELILHAGDIGGDDILIELQAIAPVLAVRGNMDYGAWLEDIPASREITLGNQSIFLVHDPSHVDFDPEEKGFQGITGNNRGNFKIRIDLRENRNGLPDNIGTGA